MLRGTLKEPFQRVQKTGLRNDSYNAATNFSNTTSPFFQQWNDWSWNFDRYNNSREKTEQTTRKKKKKKLEKGRKIESKFCELVLASVERNKKKNKCKRKQIEKKKKWIAVKTKQTNQKQPKKKQHKAPIESPKKL